MEERRPSHTAFTLPDPGSREASPKRTRESWGGDHAVASSWLSSFLRRLLKVHRAALFTFVAITAFLLVATSHPPTRHLLAHQLHSSSSPPPAHLLPATLVGPRKTPNQYYGKCSSDAFLTSVRNAVIAPDGASRREYETPDATSVNLPAFNFSFTLPGCPQPHIFTSEEACDLISSFGGIFMRGDSFVRHVHNALLMILRGRTDGAMIEQGHNSRCRGDGMFDDRRECRSYLLEDSQDSNEPLCDGDIYAFYLRASMAHSVKFIQPVIDLAARSYPGVLSIWSGLHAPGSNLGEEYVESQGREVVLTYNEKVQRLINFRSPGSLQDGAMKVLPWFNITSGAYSYDGTHYGFQVNQEKVQLLLNFLDIAWGEIASRGGVVDLQRGYLTG
ncbi:hypothetical protein RQP46_000750 [Phenoliferia psychrophenolica]